MNATQLARNKSKWKQKLQRFNCRKLCNKKKAVISEWPHWIPKSQKFGIMVGHQSAAEASTTLGTFVNRDVNIRALAWNRHANAASIRCETRSHGKAECQHVAKMSWEAQEAPKTNAILLTSPELKEMEQTRC